jgi:hypothetical protein
MRRLLVLLVLAASTAVALTPPAHAGGPTSVLITDPATGHATGLYYSEAAYDDLSRLLADGERLPSEPAGLGSRALNLTWLIHDVQPWQTQQLYPDADGGPVVVTHGTEAMGNADDAVWTRPAEGKALQYLVDSVLAGSAPAGPAPAPEPSPDPVVTEKVVTETAWWSLTGWRWLVPGLVLGAGAALLVRARVARDVIRIEGSRHHFA